MSTLHKYADCSFIHYVYIRLFTLNSPQWISQRGLMYVHVFIRVKYTNYALFRRCFFSLLFSANFFSPFNCAWCVHDRVYVGPPSHSSFTHFARAHIRKSLHTCYTNIKTARTVNDGYMRRHVWKIN